MKSREDLAREAGCLDLIVPRPGPDGRVLVGPVAHMPAVAFSTGTTEVNLTGGWKSVRPLYRERQAPCQEGCPAGEDVARYLRAVQRGRYDEGWRLIMEENPFPSVMGRVCYHPCEGACNRGSYDEPVAIHAIERFLGDYGLMQHLRIELSVVPRKEQVAIIGAGPAGLATAYHLTRHGYRVTVFEARPEPGGVLRWGIPPYRLPREILRQEIARLESLGIQICSGAAVGRDVAWEALKAYQAILLATGLPRGRRLVDGGEGMAGLYDGLEFLRQVAGGTLPRVGRRVTVIGGGNVAIDVARTAIRLGAGQVSLVCVEPAEVMPAHPEEIEEAAREGVEFQCGFAVRQCVAINGQVSALEIVRARYLGRDPDGGVRFEPVGGSLAPIPADTVIQAIGQEADLGFLPREVMDAGRLRSDGWARLQGTVTFAAGDVVSGPARIVDAIASGKGAAMGIHRCLSGGSSGDAGEVVQAVQVGDLNLLYFARTRRRPIPQLPPATRVESMGEVNGGWGVPDAAAEAARCFTCGLCTGCDNCLVFCPDVAIRKGQHPDTYDVLDQFCKGCGICARECPRHVIAMVPATL